MVAGWYRRWAVQEPTSKAVVVYDSMWDSTDVMARAIAEGLIHSGASVKVMPLSGSHRSDIATELLEAGALIVGSPTLNNQMFPTVADAVEQTGANVSAIYVPGLYAAEAIIEAAAASSNAIHGRMSGNGRNWNTANLQPHQRQPRQRLRQSTWG